MGIRLMVEVMEHAPDDLTWRDRYVLLAIAENLKDETRAGWPGFDGEDEFAGKFRRRTRCSRTQFYEVLGALTEMELVVILEPGHNGRRAKYSIPPIAGQRFKSRPSTKGKRSVQETGTLQGDGEPLDTHRGPFPEPSVNPHGTLAECVEDPGNRDTTAEVVSRFPGSSVRETGTPTPQISSVEPLKEEGPTADAVGVLGAADADASAGVGKPPRSVTESSTRSVRDRRLKDPLMAYLAALGDEAMDVIVGELEKREGRLLRWGRKKAAAEFGIPATTSLCDDLTGRYTCRAVAAVLMRQTQSDGGGLVGDVKDYLAGFEWPDDRPAPKRRSGAAAEARKLLPPVEKYTPPTGTLDRDVHVAMFEQVATLHADALFEKLLQLRAYRRADIDTYAAKAHARCEEVGAEQSDYNVARLTIQYAIQHYSGSWPMFVNPAEPVDIEAILVYEKALAELREAAEVA